jgi:hypothetical protein
VQAPHEVDPTVRGGGGAEDDKTRGRLGQEPHRLGAIGDRACREADAFELVDRGSGEGRLVDGDEDRTPLQPWGPRLAISSLRYLHAGATSAMLGD